MFADMHNHIVPRYCSEQADGLSYLVNGLRADLKTEHVYCYPPYSLVPSVIKDLLPMARGVIYLHHEFNGPNYYSVILASMFSHRILIGGRYFPATLTPCKKSSVDGYFRPYSEPKLTFLYFRGYSELSLLVFTRNLVHDNLNNLQNCLKFWALRVEYPQIFCLERLDSR